MQANLTAGLISGLIVTLFVLVFRHFWNSVIVPWFEERVYKDVHIEGKWYGLYPTSTDCRQDVINLKRHGHKISGKLTCINGSDEGHEYNLCGSFRNLILPLTYESTDKTKTDRGTITLRSIKNGMQLSGKIAFYYTSGDSIEAGNIHWFRSKKEMNQAIDDRALYEKELLSMEEDELNDVVNNEDDASTKNTANKRLTRTRQKNAAPVS